MKHARKDNRNMQFPLRAFSFFLVSIIPTLFTVSVFFACVTERDKTSVVAEGEELPVRDPNYYYLPDYESYYYPPNHQWIYYDHKSKEWLVTHLRPPKMKDADLKRVYLVRLDYEGFTPYQFYETHKIKYPPARGNKTHPMQHDSIEFMRKRAEGRK
jgi:hypothetical protein